MVALTLHEAVPGHHLQIALAQELAELPTFRRYAGFTAFVEGWGALLREPRRRDGPLRRPVREVRPAHLRDVARRAAGGRHRHARARAGRREQAIDFFLENAAKTELDIANEVDRYIAWPGQALAYKIGELKIRSCARAPTEALGERFDLREFHDVVLGSGAVPLDVLESNVRRWIESRCWQRAQRPASGERDCPVAATSPSASADVRSAAATRSSCSR